MSVMKLKLGLIGKDVSKSDSEKIHKFILKKLGVACEYERISIQESELLPTLKRLFSGFDGFNVTIPYKLPVMKYLNGVLGDAKEYGAVNTVVCGTKTGYNTDGRGFLQALRAEGFEPFKKRALVLGAGGSGRSTAIALKTAGADVFTYRRNQELLKETCLELGVKAVENPKQGGFDLVINATGVGMHDSVGKSPVDGNAFSGAELAMDLIYRPSESEFLRLAKANGVKTLNGASMLFYQAYYADCYYLSRQADEKEAESFYKEYLLENIVH